MAFLRFAVLSVLTAFCLTGCLQGFEQVRVSPDAQYAPQPTTDEKPDNLTRAGYPDDDKNVADDPDTEAAPEPSGQDPAESEGPEAETGVKYADKEACEPVKSAEKQPTLDEALDFVQAAQDFWQKGELENALEALDQAYSLILVVETGEDPKLLQQKEDLRYLISRRILEIYASRNIVTNGNHKEIPVTINRHVQSEIDLFTKGRERDFFREAYRRSGRYRPMIIKALREAGLPEELSWLPLIESGYKEKALSKARALGLWQFIPSTGYKFGLKRNTYIDERLDPVKATHAAIAYMKELHQIFGDYTTVLAAYNCGEGKVLRVIRNQNVNYLDNFWDLYQRLPWETARYVPRFLATVHIVNNLEKYGLADVEVYPPVEYEVVEVARKVRLRDVAAKIGVRLHDLSTLNPELRYNILPPEKYSLRVPVGKMEGMAAKLDEIPLSSSPYAETSASFLHRVRPGETLSTIARKYHVSVASIQRVNNIRRRNFIVAGQKLRIPGRGAPSSASTSRSGSPPPGGVYKVKSGDSLWILAKRYGTTTKAISELNNLRSSRLHIGQKLKIPGDAPEPKASSQFKTYQVRRGDSPYRIAQQHRMPLEKFLRINHLTPRSRIYPGQHLYVE